MASFADWRNRASQKANDVVDTLAGTRLAELARLIPGYQFAGKGARVLGGYGGLAAGLAAALELTDQSEPLAQNAAQAGGQFLGGGAGALIGGILIPGPIGAIGGGIVGSMVGRGLGDGAYTAMAGDPNDPLKQQQRAADAALAQRVKEARAMMPIQADAAALARENERLRAETAARLQSRQIMDQLFANRMLEQQRGAARDTELATSAILGFGGGGNYGI